MGQFRQIVKEAEDLFMLFRRQVLRGRRSSRRDQEKHAPRPCAKPVDQLRNLVQPAYIVPRHCGIDLGWQADFASVFQSEHRAGKRTIDPAEAVVTPGVRPVEADGHAGHPTFLKPFDRTLRQ
jgi:hypothetical protein